MTAINAKAFRPKVPLSSPRLLQGNYAVEALACKLQSGAMDPFKGLSLVRTSPASTILSMFRYRNAGIDYWVEWPVAGVNVARSPNSQDARNRLYWSGDGEPRMGGFADVVSGAGAYPGAWYVLGVYIPVTAMAGTVSGGTTPVETRSYTYTFVTQYGEEGAPCGTPLVLDGNANGTWNLTGMETAPPNNGTVSGATIPVAGTVRVTVDSTRGISPYEQVTFASVGGMTDLNATLTVTAVIDSTHLEVALATAQTYTSGGTWARRAPHNVTNMKKRIYRTVGTNTDYKFVAEIAAGTTTYADSLTSTQLGAAITTLNSYTPPKNGHELTPMANGSHCMLAGNEVCFSEIGKPHSWPIGNRYSFSGIGVSATAVGNNVVIGTDSAPIIAVASTPDGAQLVKLEDTVAPNVAKLGTVDTGVGAMWPSQDGLWLVTPSGARNITEKLYSFEQWQALIPTSFKAAFVDTDYWAMHDLGDGSAARLMQLDTTNADGIVEVEDQFLTLFANPFDGRMYGSKANKIYLWDQDDTNRYLATWRGPDTQLGRRTNFSMAQVHADYSQIVPIDLSIQEANAALMADANLVDGAVAVTPLLAAPIAGSAILEQPEQTQRRVQFTLLDNGAVRFTRDVTSSKPFRLPAGYKSEVIGIQIAASTRVYSVTIAEGKDQLRDASV